MHVLPGCLSVPNKQIEVDLDRTSFVPDSGSLGVVWMPDEWSECGPTTASLVCDWCMPLLFVLASGVHLHAVADGPPSNALNSLQ
mmetsp:Transcript_37259/g.55593  ORF Transcript_37259/g.55593 Transcript_37259/m.55593 type:complete len:85 (-) Transcript_37259:67-321(-)